MPSRLKRLICALTSIVLLTLSGCGGGGASGSEGQSNNPPPPQNSPPTPENQEKSGDLSADTSTTGTLRVGSLVAGTVGTSSSSDSSDWYAINLTAGVHYKFDMHATHTGTSFDSSLTLNNSSGSRLTISKGAWENVTDHAIQFVPSTSGVFYLAVLATSSQYTLSVSSKGSAGYIPPVVDASNPARWVQVGTTSPVFTASGGTDSPIHVYLEAGKYYYFKIYSHGAFSGEIPIYASLADSTGAVRVANTYPITYTPSASGVYRLVVPPLTAGTKHVVDSSSTD